MQAPNKSKRSIVHYFAFAGALVPLGFLVFNWIGFTLVRNYVPRTAIYALYVWPSSIMLWVTHDNFSIHTLIVLGLSIAVNVLLYTMIGLLVKGVMVAWRRLFKTT